MSIKENLDIVNTNILKACEKANRKFEEVTLIAVTKTKPVEDMIEAINYGIINVGENKVQEIRDKYEIINNKCNWHMIGHLQTNKVKYIVDKVSYIHSVDSLKLAQTISNEAVKKSSTINILIQVNVSNEESKFGIICNEVENLIRDISKLSNIKVKGLMTVAPYVVNPEKNRLVFRKLREIYVDIKQKNIDNVNMDILSMGMTNDYIVAIEEGSTMVRIGTGIFGKRNYMKG
jgi:pyridoxal phosphate enzyme (YggS family)